MRKVLAILILVIGTGTVLGQGEGLKELSFERQQYRTVPQHHSLRSGSATATYFFQDTLLLPFYDDFATNRTKRYNYPAGFMMTNIYGSGTCCLQDTATLDSIALMFSPSWNYTFDPADTTIDSTQKPQTWIVLFNDTLECDKRTGDLFFWPTYYHQYKFDTVTGNPTDSVAVPADTVIYFSNALQFAAADTTKLWLDNFVFINNTYPIAPPSIGVATFNGLNDIGLPYNFNNNSYGLADYLTSKPINLSGWVPSDSIYLSFFYQPQGVGDAPNSGDSLVLEFYSPDSGWVEMWVANDDSFAAFRQVLIPVLDSSMFSGSFQFRFYNYATTSGNNDHWHLDYVHLEQNRTAVDTLLDDIAFTSVPLRAFKEFTAMPFTHYSDTDLVDTLSLTMRNQFGIVKSVNYRYRAEEGLTGTQLNAEQAATNINGESDTTKVFTTGGVQLLPSPEDSALLKITYTIDGGDPFPQDGNDSVTICHPLYNYYAYDDGSAEKAYFLKAIGARLAYRFTSRKPDTLRGVMFHWAHMNVDASKKLFSLMVWNSVGGLPGAVLYQEDFQKPIYDDTLNGFWLYPLDVPLVLPAGTFYVGWLQSVREDLNVGYDVNNNAKPYLYYDVGLGWKNTDFTGAVMIRPVFGENFPTSIPMAEPAAGITRVFPNPFTDQISVSGLGNTNFDRYELYDIAGRLLSTGSSEPVLDLSGMEPAIYLFKLLDTSTGDSVVHKLVKSY